MGRRNSKVEVKRDTLLEDFIGKYVLCHLESGIEIRGRLERISKYEIELKVGVQRVIVLKHSLLYVDILEVV